MKILEIICSHNNYRLKGKQQLGDVVSYMSVYDHKTSYVTWCSTTGFQDLAIFWFNFQVFVFIGYADQQK